jgi:hypothetical protein
VSELFTTEGTCKENNTMRPKLYIQITCLLLIASLLLSACASQVESVENTAATSATPLAPAPFSAEPPQPAETSPTATLEVDASGCPLSGEPLYVNSLFGYCFVYPEDFFVQVDNPLAPVIVGPALDENPDPLFASLAVSTRPVPEGADLGGLVSGFLGQNNISQLAIHVQRTQVSLGGKPAEVLEGVPGRLSARVVMALHGSMLYQLYFHPTGMEAAAADMEGLYQKVLDTFAFFPGEGQLVVQPEPAVFFEFERFFKFTYDPVLALLVEPETTPAIQLTPDVMFAEAHPAFVQFRFLGYNGGRPALLPYPFQTPRLMIFQTRDFGDYGQDQPTGFSHQLDALRLLLDTQPDLAEHCTRTAPVSGETALPFLPWLNSAQVFCAQPQYVEFNGGKGIRYLTAFSQGPEPLLDLSIFYTFQGISEDGEFYFSAVFPVQTGVFPLESQPVTYGEDDLPPQAMTAEQLSALNAQAGDLFQPALGQLDALVSSLEVEK